MNKGHHLTWHATIQNPQLEADFIDFQADKTRPLVLGVIGILLLVEVIAVSLDFYASEGAATSLFTALMRTLTIVFEVLCWWLIYRYPKHNNAVVLSLTFIIMVMMLWGLHSHDSYDYIVPITLISTSLVVYILAPINWSYRVIFNIIFTLSGLWIWIQKGPDIMDVNRVLVWLLFAQGAGMLSAYISSRNSRILYLQSLKLRRQLAREKQLLARNNTIIDVLSHEVRTPLSTICLQADMLDGSDQPGSLDQSVIRRIKNTSQSLVKMMDGWIISGKELDFSTSQINTHLQPIINQAVETVQHTFVDAKIRLQSKQRLNTYFDERVLLVAIKSLLNNSLQHGHSTYGSSISSYLIKDTVYVCIRDWGKGMPTEEVLTLFDRRPATTISDSDGLGVGLHLLRKLIHSSGGDLRAYSSPQTGTLMILTLPKV